MAKIYAKINDSLQQVGGSMPPEMGWVEMQSQRPLEDGTWLAQADGTWMRSGTELDDAKKAKVQELKNARNTQEQSGFAYMGVVFDSDSVSFQRMLGADNAALKSQMQGLPFEIDWTVQDNSSVHMTLEQTLGMVPTFAKYSSALHDKCNDFVAQVEAATTVEEVQAITWE